MGRFIAEHMRYQCRVVLCKGWTSSGPQWGDIQYR